MRAGLKIRPGGRLVRGRELDRVLPNVGGVDLTVGVRNLLAVVPGRLGDLGREDVPAIRLQPDRHGVQGVVPVLTVPGPGFELFARAGYRF